MTNKIHIGQDVYNNNLDLYTIIKLLLQSKLTANRLVTLQNIINNSNGIVPLKDNIVSAGFDKLDYLLSYCDSIDDVQFRDYMDISIDLLQYKDLILAESKVYVSQEYKREMQSIDDKLSIEYDISMLHLPYGQRVVSALLVYALSNTQFARDNYFVTTHAESNIEQFAYKCKNISNKYLLNINSMFQIIIDESINQSIRADAGNQYEDRVRQVLCNLATDVAMHKHDSNIRAVEYDFKFVYNGKLCGVSAKRTLRERYKQNIDDIDRLDVDYLFVFTLGVDINNVTMQNILSKRGVYIVVSAEQYKLKAFLQNNSRVGASNDVKNFFDKVII